MSLPARAVCLDAQGAQSPEHQDRGIARYVMEHVRALHRIRPAALQSVLLNPSLPLTGNADWLLGTDLLGWSTEDRRVARRPKDAPEIYHVMSPFELQRTLDEIWPAWARGPRVRTVITLYDLIPLVFADHYLRDPVVRTRYEARSELVKQADHVLAISETTARDAIDLLGISPQKVSVIDAGVTEKFAHMHGSKAAALDRVEADHPTIHGGYMLYVAGFEFRKNLERLIAGYGLLPAQLRAAHQLVIACRMLPSEAELLGSWADAAGIEHGQLVITGYVSDAELGSLYHGCELFVFPSIYEGSGLPILEAMSCGAPVIASSTATGGEILGDLEGTFDPYDPAAIAGTIAETITSPTKLTALSERSRRRAGLFTWDRVAERSLEAYGQVLAENSRRARRRRPRIAMVTPWPPQRSGIADYNLRLARELGQKVDVEVVVAGSLEQYAPPQERGVRLVTSDSFRIGEGLHRPDRVLYCMGNSSFHRHVYELMRERPGAVVAHDVRLTGFYGWFSGVERPEDPGGRLGERIEALYGPRLPAVASATPPDWRMQSALGIYMTREMQEYAEQLFVHSHYAREVLELDRAPLDRTVPIAVLPFGIPDAEIPAEPRQTLGEDPLVVSVGVLSEVKGLTELIAAIALVAERHPTVRLVLAGPADETERERWRRFARDVAPGVNVEIPGHVEPEVYAQLLREASVAVQLRTISNGEASAAVADCLSAGTPTIATDIGWVSELPSNVLSKLAPTSPATVLAEHLEQLLDEPVRRQALSDGALAHASSHSFRHVADAYLQALQLV
jgi:glycosyltransferase involved in cell wall biosynthesis